MKGMAEERKPSAANAAIAIKAAIDGDNGRQNGIMAKEITKSKIAVSKSAAASRL